MERPSEAIDLWRIEAFKKSNENTEGWPDMRRYLEYGDWLEAEHAVLKAEHAKLKAEHAKCPREVLGDEITEGNEWWDGTEQEWVRWILPANQWSLQRRYIVRKRQAPPTKEERFMDELAHLPLVPSYESNELILAAARKAGLLDDES